MSSMQATLTALDKALGIPTPKVVRMTKAQYDAHVAAEIAKAKAETEEADKEKGAEKAKKRLSFLRAVTKLLVGHRDQVAKASWEGGNGTAAIPVYEEGFEPPTEMPTEAQVSTPPAIGGTAGDGQSVFSNAPPSLDQPSVTPKSNGTNLPAIGTGTQGDQTFAAQGGTQSFAKAMGELTETLKSLGGAPAAGTPTQQAPAAQQPAAGLDDPSVWPRDLANKDFLKEGVAKRAEEWGTDPWAATK